MSRESIVFLFGILLLLMPHLGVPDGWKQIFYTVAGAVLMVAGYSLRRSAFLRRIQQLDGELKADSFAEHDASTTEVGSDKNIDNVEEEK